MYCILNALLVMTFCVTLLKMSSTGYITVFLENRHLPRHSSFFPCFRWFGGKKWLAVILGRWWYAFPCSKRVGLLWSHPSCLRKRRSNATASSPSFTSSSVSTASRPSSSAWLPCSAWPPPSPSRAGGPATSCCWRPCLATASPWTQRTSAKVCQHANAVQ